MLQPLSAPGAAQAAYALSPQGDKACLNLSAPKCDRTVCGPLHAVAEHASACGYRCSEALSLSLLSPAAPGHSTESRDWAFCGLSILSILVPSCHVVQIAFWLWYVFCVTSY